MPVIIVSSSKEFKKVLKNANKVLVKFEANWSMPCKATVRSFEEFSKQREDIQAISLDIDGSGIRSILKKHQVKSVPSFLYFVAGNYVRRFVGNATKNDLHNLLEEE